MRARGRSHETIAEVLHRDVTLMVANNSHIPDVLTDLGAEAVSSPTVAG